MVPKRQLNLSEQRHTMTQARIGTVVVFHALTEVLTVGSLVSVDEEEGVTREHKAGATRAVRDTDALTVSSYQESVNKTRTASARQP